ncbi:hypothetical protein GIB67_021696, partial [Kingdonia uniflora]
GRFPLEFDENVSIIGEYHTKFTTKCGELARTYVSSISRDWCLIGKDVKKMIRDDVYLTFELDPKVHKKKYVKEEDWYEFVDDCSTDNVMNCRVNGKYARSKMHSPHTTGRMGCTRKKEKMEKENPGLKVKKTHLFMACHTKADGNGRHCPRTFTNQRQTSFSEPHFLTLTDPKTYHQPIKEDALRNIPIIAFCDTDSPMRMASQMRDTILPGQIWDVMVDLFFYREPEETKEEEKKAPSGCSPFANTYRPSMSVPPRSCELLDWYGVIVAYGTLQQGGRASRDFYNILIDEIIHITENGPLEDGVAGEIIVWEKSCTLFILLVYAISFM